MLGHWGVGGSDRFVAVMVGCPDWLVGSLLCVKKKKMWVGEVVRGRYV